MRYPGGKGGAGVFQTIINQFPPHRVYIEAFAGGANIFERKAPAASSILVELDPAQAETLRASTIGRADVEVRQGDALELLSSYPWVGDELVYLDPPYLHSTRKDVALYRQEMTIAQHERLLAIIANFPAKVALSGYRSAMYDEWAHRHLWRRIDFQAMTRRGPATESLWMNYPAPARLADSSYAGSDFRERERIKRKAARFVAKWDKLPELERGAIVQAMGERWSTSAPAVAMTAAESNLVGQALARATTQSAMWSGGLFETSEATR
jgi:DNA adenine methylase